MECLSCKSNEGIHRISPGKTIYEGQHWLVEHAYPCSLEGWTVIVLKRHCEEMHNLSQDEFQELSKIQFSLIQALKKYLHSEREYIFCFCEAEGFKHIHFHVVPKHDGFDDAYKGAKVFHYIKPTEEEKLAEDRVEDICDELGELMK